MNKKYTIDTSCSSMPASADGLDLREQLAAAERKSAALEIAAELARESRMEREQEQRETVERLTQERDEARAKFTVPVVCMCGSTRFKQTWIAENARLTGDGQIVLSVGLWGHHERVYPDAETKVQLDELHKRKIDLCDWVWVLDVNGYIGESTRSEIEYAKSLGREIRYLSKEFPGYIEQVDPMLQRAEAAEAKLALFEGLDLEVLESL
jgi:hypothetical protein